MYDKKLRNKNTRIHQFMQRSTRIRYTAPASSGRATREAIESVATGSPPKIFLISPPRSTAPGKACAFDSGGWSPRGSKL